MEQPEGSLPHSQVLVTCPYQIFCTWTVNKFYAAQIEKGVRIVSFLPVSKKIPLIVLVGLRY